MCEPEPIHFPNLTDEVVIAIDDLLEAFYDRFLHRYFPQMTRYCATRHQPDELQQIPLPLEDPPF